MCDVSVIGLGAMGSAIAKAELQAGYSVTVWNRSPEKVERLAALGANGAKTLEKAITSSPRIIICIDGYEATQSMLCQAETAPLLKDSTIIQMSTGTSKQARDAEQWVHELGAYYLDCSIMVYPETVGSDKAQLLVSGDDAIYQDCKPYIEAVAGDIRYLGSKIGAAAALDLAVVSRLVAMTVGIAHGVHACESEGVSLEQYADMFADGERARSLAMTVHRNDFENNIAASVNVSIGVISSIKKQAEDLGINSEFPDFLLNLYERAVAAGYRHQDNASLVKLFRANPK